MNFTVNKLPNGAVPEAYQELIAVTGGVQPYTYSITAGSLPPGLTLNSLGVVIGTPTTAGNYQFTVKVVDSQTPVQAFNSETLTLIIAPALSIPPTTLPNAVIAVAYSNAVVASGGVSPYSYTVTSDPSCLFSTSTLPNDCSSSNHGLTFGTDGTISGKATGPTGSYNFTVQVTDAGSAVATNVLTLTIVGKLQGNYAFSFTGYNTNGQPFFMAGSFCADGNGNINPSGNSTCPNPGVMDRNGSDPIGAVTNVPITGGTYTIGDNNLGTMTILTANNALNFQYNLAVSLVTDSRFILADPNNPAVWGSGVLKSQQNLSQVSFSLASFALGWSGVGGTGARYAGAGYFALDSTGKNITAGLADTNDNGTLQSAMPLTGTVSSIDLSTGRGTATFIVGATTLDYAFYVVSPSVGQIGNPVLAVQTDPISGGTPVTQASFLPRGSAGTCRNGTFSNKCLSTNYPNDSGPPSTTNAALFQLSAVSNLTPDLSLGLAQFDGQGGIQTYALDENNGGTLTPPSQYPYSSGTYNVDATSGRVTVALNGAPYQPVWYLTNFNTGFVVGTDPSVTTGSFDPQTSQPPFFNENLLGPFYGGSATPVQSTVTNEVESALITPPPPPGGLTGVFASTYDTSGGLSGLQSNQTFSGTYCLVDQNNPATNCLPSNTTSRIAILNSNNTPTEILYIISAGAAGATNNGTKVVSLTVATPAGNPEPNPRLVVRTH